MTDGSRMVRVLAAAAAALFVVTSSTPAAGQAADSRARAAEIVALMNAQQLDSAAAEDLAHPGRFMAVLHIPGVQLLAVAGECQAVEALRATLARKAYRDLYMDLNACAAKDTKLFVQDMGADGLRASRSGATFDTAYEHVDQQTTFNGEWKDQQLSESEYQARFARVEAAYADLLRMVAAHLKGA